MFPECFQTAAVPTCQTACEPKKQRRSMPPCYECGKHMWGRNHVMLKNAVDNHDRVFHKQCACAVLDREPAMWVEVTLTWAPPNKIE